MVLAGLARALGLGVWALAEMAVNLVVAAMTVLVPISATGAACINKTEIRFLFPIEDALEGQVWLLLQLSSPVNYPSGNSFDETNS